MEKAPDGRATFEETFMEMARVLARMRGDCTKRKVAAIIFNPANGDLIEAGYNGAPAGHRSCLQGACPRGQHYQVFHNHGMYAETGYACACGADWPCPQYSEPGSSYDTGPGSCIAIHAEANALLRAGKAARGMSMVVTEEPCGGCIKLIQGAKIVRVITPGRTFYWLCGQQDEVRLGCLVDRRGSGRQRHLAGR